jgi:Fungal Zn(2)-Cys(6) binuclear cluster domain
MNPHPDTLKRKAHQLHDDQPYEVRSQRRRRTPPATLPSAPDTSTNVTPQSVAHTGLSRPSPGFEAGDRLPGVRQLLLPHSFAGSAHSTSSTRQRPEQSRRFSSITMSPLSESLPSPSIRASEMSIRTPLSEPHKSVLSAGQCSDSTSADAMAAINNKTQHFAQATQQQFPRLSFFTDSVSSHQSSKYSMFQANQSPCGSPGSDDINQHGNYGTYARQQGDLHESQRLTQRSIGSNPWQNAHNHLDWGTTKAGKPRKRLAQACLSCRQKKIRCHPNPKTTKCLQCEKAGSGCKFESGCVVSKAKLLTRG